MADGHISKAVVKLPRKNRQSTINDRVYLVSDRLYFEVPGSVHTKDIQDLLQSCSAKDIVFIPQPSTDYISGYITFPTKDKADCAFTLFNGVHMKNGYPLHLYIRSSATDPEPAADILQVKHLPASTTNQSLYDQFRPLGAMSLCKIIVEDGQFKGTALVRFYAIKDAEQAVAVMNNKRIQETTITICPFASYDSSINCASTDQHNNIVDYTNLYIKNLDLNAKSSDLFKHFRKFGRIISARVMKNARTSQSKGFGFVSFANREEAYSALQEMNGRYIMSKPILVAFHEPKKTRSDRTNGDTASLNDTQSMPNDSGFPTSSPSPPSLSSYQHQQRNDQHLQNQHEHFAVQEVSMPLQVKPNSYQSNHMDQPYRGISPTFNGNRSNRGHDTSRPCGYKNYLDPNNDYPVTSKRHIPNHRDSPQHQHHHQNYQVYYNGNSPLPRVVSNNVNTPPALSMMPSIQASPLPKVTPRERPTLRRRGSIESICSVMTETSTQAQRQRMTHAVLKCGQPVDQIDGIVDMLLTLKKKERSLCLFNPDFLKSKVQQAQIALETFDEDEEEEEEEEEEEQEGEHHHHLRHHLQPFSTPASALQQPLKLIKIGSHHKKVEIAPQAISSVLPLSDSAQSRQIEKSASNNTRYSATKLTSSSVDNNAQAPRIPTTEDMNQFLSTLQGLTMHEKKQKLGDRLFPLVKATGVKHAPKMTIRLLDTVPLYDLAHSMYSDTVLRQKIDEISATNQTAVV